MQVRDNNRELAVLAGIAITASTLMGAVVLRIYFRAHPASMPATQVRVDPKLLIGARPDFRGAKSSPYTLVEFADFQCPPCAATYPKLRELISRLDGKVKLTFRHYPLAMHPNARAAAEAAERARIQGSFWTFHDAIFRLKGKFTDLEISATSTALGLPTSGSGNNEEVRARAAVDDDVRCGNLIGVNGTPTFFLILANQRVWRLGSISQLDTLIAPGS